MIPLLLLGCQPVDPALLPDGELPPPMSLDGSPMVPGQPLRLEVEGAAPQAALTVLMGRLGVACPPQASGCLDISPPYTTVGNARADAAGRATLSVPVPPGMPRGRQMHFQAVSDPRRLSKSNVLTRVVGQSCRFGDLLAEEQIGGFLADQDRIYDDGTWLYVSTNTTLHQLDFDLVPTGRQSPLGVYGNHGFAYDRRGDRLLAFSTASAPGQVWEYNHDGSALVAGPVPTGSNTGGGAVDRGGVLHVVERVSEPAHAVAARHFGAAASSYVCVDTTRQIGYVPGVDEELHVVDHPRYGAVTLGRLLEDMPLGQPTSTIRLVCAPELVDDLRPVVEAALGRPRGRR